MSVLVVDSGLWNFRTAGNIWKIIPADPGLIVGEERDLAGKTVSYFCVALDDGRVKWQGKRLAESWWTGIESVHRGILFIHEYPVPSMPDHKKILAIDTQTGDTLWENPDLAFGFAVGASVYASKELFDRKAYYELDLMTGAVKREIPSDDLLALRAEPGPGWGGDVQFPDWIPDPAAPVRGAFPDGVELQPGESLSHDGAEITTCYEVLPPAAGARKLREHLFVIDVRSGALVFRDVVCDDLSLPAGSTFFRVEERILYVKDRTTLRSFTISDGVTK